MALTAARVVRLLALRGKLVAGVAVEPPEPTELRLRLDRVLFPEAR